MVHDPQNEQTDGVAGAEDPASVPSTERGGLVWSGGATADADAPDDFDVLETPELGQNIEHFRVLRTLGRGGMGRVLLARDTRLGRLVALKIIRTDRIAPERVQALIEEARVTASLSHPNIVTVFHVGRWGQVPYMALEYIDGITLRQRLRERTPTVPEALRIVLPIARALAAAHAAHIIHCDLKPENILLPTDGRVRVVDFGIAAVLETLSGVSPKDRARPLLGTPSYMAPEQWEGGEIHGAADMWALGVVFYELLAGFRPFEAPGADARPLALRVVDAKTVVPPLHHVPPPVASLCMSLLERDPAARPPPVQVAEHIEQILARGSVTGTEHDVPFRGLAAFEEQHAAYFFGREREVDSLVEKLRVCTVIPVVGASGAGKSSLVQAGVIPRLREASPWTVVRLRPGARPLIALAGRLLTMDSGAAGASRSAVEELASQIAHSPAHVNVLLHELAEATRTQVLLFVDQLEEIATLCADPAEAEAFVTAVAGAADPIDVMVRVIVTLRDDFLGRVATGEAMRAALAHVEVLRRLDGRALQEAATLPLERLGYRWDDPSVAERMVAELRGEPAALPLLQFACAAVWERRDQHKRLLRLADYEAMGGVAGALVAHAESVLDGLVSADLEVARRLMLRLVTPEGTRRVVERSVALQGLGPNAARVQERMTNARLLVARRTRDGNDALLELAHESLIRTWPQLARWLEESSEEHTALAQVDVAAKLWQSRGRRNSELWDLDAAQDAARRLRHAEDRLGPEGKAFLVQSRDIGQRAQRQRRVLLVLGAAALVAITIVSLLVAAELSERERTTRQQAAQISLADADMGLVRLELGLVDWNPDTLTASQAPVPAGLSWRLREVQPGDTPGPGPVRDPRFVRVRDQFMRDGRYVIDLETRSGAAYLEVDGRGQPGERCAPSLLPIRRLPGFAARSEKALVFAVTIPTCAASLAGTVEVPGGPFWFGGPGDPPIVGHLEPRTKKQIDLAPFRIDRSEIPNAQYAIYAQNAALTGERMPDYPPDETVKNAAKPDHPVTAIDFYAAQNFCAWMGKTLPSTEEVTKAGRGGLFLDAAGKLTNPMPLRNLPWGQGDLAGRVNLAGEQDGWRNSAPVTAFPSGASPYGVLGLIDNVAEWTTTPGGGARPEALRVIRGADWGTSMEDGVHGLDVQNERNPRYFSFVLGGRCVLKQK